MHFTNNYYLALIGSLLAAVPNSLAELVPGSISIAVTSGVSDATITEPRRWNGPVVVAGSTITYKVTTDGVPDSHDTGRSVYWGISYGTSTGMGTGYNTVTPPTLLFNSRPDTGSFVIPSDQVGNYIKLSAYTCQTTIVDSCNAAPDPRPYNNGETPFMLIVDALPSTSTTTTSSTSTSTTSSTSTTTQTAVKTPPASSGASVSQRVGASVMLGLAISSLSYFFF